MEENTQEESEVSVNIQEIPQTPTQTPLEVGHNDIHMQYFTLTHVVRVESEDCPRTV